MAVTDSRRGPLVGLLGAAVAAILAAVYLSGGSWLTAGLLLFLCGFAAVGLLLLA